jgi:hypothetical protein
MMIVRLALRELIHHFRLVFIMVLAVGIPLMSFFTLEAYHAGLIARYSGNDKDFLVVQLSGSFGEIVGSRLSAQVGAELRSAGASVVIPEIHAIVGCAVSPWNLIPGWRNTSWLLDARCRKVINHAWR